MSIRTGEILLYMAKNIRNIVPSRYVPIPAYLKLRKCPAVFLFRCVPGLYPVLSVSPKTIFIKIRIGNSANEILYFEILVFFSKSSKSTEGPKKEIKYFKF